jgi:hypothetical protein
MIKNNTEQPKMKIVEITQSNSKPLTVVDNTLESTLYLNNLYADSMEYHYLLPCA